MHLQTLHTSGGILQTSKMARYLWKITDNADLAYLYIKKVGVCNKSTHIT